MPMKGHSFVPRVSLQAHQARPNWSRVRLVSVSQDALSRIRVGGRRVALVAFGHMHHRLRHRNRARGGAEAGAPLRRMVMYDSTTGGRMGRLDTARLPY